MVEIRKVTLLREQAFSEMGHTAKHPVVRAVALVAIHNPFARRFVGDLKTFDRGSKLMHLGVLRSLRCPGVLVESGFLTSVEEAKKISTPAYREQLARTLAAGIRDYAATLARAGKK